MVLGSGRNSSPVGTGAMFSVFQAVRNTVFSGIAFRGALGDDFSTFWRILGSAGPPSGATLATMGRLFREGIFDGFWVPKRSIFGIPPAQGNPSTKSGWPRARKKLITLWYHAS